MKKTAINLNYGQIIAGYIGKKLVKIYLWKAFTFKKENMGVQ